ncbi:hypothetical protein JOQ06_014236, partial [Pogonophryne albipinna]
MAKVHILYKLCVACGLNSSIHCFENKAPQCALFSTFLRPDISPAAGKGRCLKRENVCVREEARPPPDPA